MEKVIKFFTKRFPDAKVQIKDNVINFTFNNGHGIIITRTSEDCLIAVTNCWEFLTRVDGLHYKKFNRLLLEEYVKSLRKSAIMKKIIKYITKRIPTIKVKIWLRDRVFILTFDNGYEMIISRDIDDQVIASIIDYEYLAGVDILHYKIFNKLVLEKYEDFLRKDIHQLNSEVL